MSLIQADRTPAGALARPFPQVPGVTHRFVTVRGIKLHVAEAGAAAGEPVLLLHGVADPASWRRGEVEEFVTASSERGTARAGEQVHWQFVLHEIPAIISRRYRHARLEMPTMILGGAQDPTLPPGLFAGAEKHGADIRVRVLQGAGQFLADERPGVVAQTARELFART